MEKLTRREKDEDAWPKELFKVDENTDIDEMEEIDILYGCASWCDEYGMCNDCPIQNCFNKLADYEDDEELGKVIRLPYAIGQVVYFIKYDPVKLRNEICSTTVEGFEIGKACTMVICSNGVRYSTNHLYAIHEEAEEKLKGMGY